MKKRNNVLVLALVLGLVMYFLDASIFYLLQKDDTSFLQALLTNVPIQEVYSRLIMVVGIFVFGLLIFGKINEIYLDSHTFYNHSNRDAKTLMDHHFMSSLSYQVRTPLNAIIGFSELLEKPDISPDSKAIYLSHINSSSKYLLLLVNNLSEISKIESEKFEIKKVGINVNKLLGEMFQIFEVQKGELGKSNIQLFIENVRLDEELIVMTDPQRLKFVLNNLMESAFIHTKQGMVKIGYTKKGNGFIEFFVKDTGTSFSQERLDVIFERYNKLTDNYNLPFDGSVIRLAISKSLVKLLGGEIRAESQVGEGVAIYFTIPFLEVNKAKEALPIKKVIEPVRKAVDTIERDWSGRFLLIAEDVDSNFIYLKEILRPTKINVLWAKNGREALDMVISNEKIAVVLMDILMPVMDGYEASREIKKIRPNLPIIAQTAYFVEDKTRDEENKNFDKYLIKPLWAPQLLKAIDGYIS